MVSRCLLRKRLAPLTSPQRGPARGRQGGPLCVGLNPLGRRPAFTQAFRLTQPHRYAMSSQRDASGSLPQRRRAERSLPGQALLIPSRVPKVPRLAQLCWAQGKPYLLGYAASPDRRFPRRGPLCLRPRGPFPKGKAGPLWGRRPGLVERIIKI